MVRRRVACLDLILLHPCMAPFRFLEAWLRLFGRRQTEIVQECPPELAACEVCRRLQCGNDEWLACENRLAAERLLRAGDRAGLETLKQTVGPKGGTCDECDHR